MVDDNVTRRNILKGVGAGIVTAATASGAAADGTDEVLVGVNGRGPAQRVAATANVHRKTIDLGSVRQVVHGHFSSQARAALENNPNVEYIEENSTYHALAQTLPWGIDRVDADVAHSNGFTGSGADVAIIDTGIDSDHPDLQDQIGTGKCFSADCCGEAGGIFCSPNDNDCHHAWDDDHDHGTHVSGTADAINNTEDVVGVSTEATLHAAKVLDGCGSGSLDSVADGIRWVADQGYDVGNMSLGADSGDQTLKDACQYAVDNGVLLVAAAGNSGPCSDCVGYPAAYSTVIAVSATTEDDSLADFSSTGPEVELAAPGKDVLSTVPPESSSDGTATFSGTSMASPHVAGAGGLLMAEGESNTNARSILQDSAEDIGLADNEQGHGLLDAEAATNALGGNSSPTVDSLSASEVETSDSDAEFDVDWQVSDSDGNLSSVDLTLTDDTDNETEDTASISVSGDTASDTTRLVAAGDDGSGNSYTVDLTVTDSDGATASDSVTVSETEDTNSSPTVDSLSASEVETSDSDAEFDVDWQVSDSDGNLSSVDLTLTDDTDNETEDTASISVSGDTASGTTRLVAAGDDGSGNSYTIDLTVTDSDGATASDSTTVSETEDTDSAPTIDKHEVTEEGSPNPHANIDDDWAVSDSDGDLSNVTIEVFEDGNLVDSHSHSVSGSDASGFDEFKIHFGGGSTYDVTLTVTDSSGNSSSDTQSVDA